MPSFASGTVTGINRIFNFGLRKLRVSEHLEFFKASPRYV
jgi:hypothetical protein